MTVTGDFYSDGRTDYVYNSARWFERNQTIEIAGNVGLATLLAAVAAARPAQSREWRELAALQSDLESFPEEPYVQVQYTSVDDVQLADGTGWSLGMSLDPAMIQISYRGGQMSGSVIEQRFVEDPSPRSTRSTSLLRTRWNSSTKRGRPCNC